MPAAERQGSPVGKHRQDVNRVREDDAGSGLRRARNDDAAVSAATVPARGSFHGGICGKRIAHPVDDPDRGGHL